MTHFKGIGFNCFLDSFGLAKNPIYEFCFIERIQYFKQSRKLLLKITGEQILELGKLEDSLYQLKRAIEENLQSKAEICFSYNIKYDSLEELVNMDWDNLLYILQKNMPSFNTFEYPIDKNILDSNLRLIFKPGIIAKKMKERSIETQIEKYFLQYFKTVVNCEIYVDDNQEFDLKEYRIDKKTGI